jgi:hypothetical protein
MAHKLKLKSEQENPVMERLVRSAFKAWYLNTRGIHSTFIEVDTYFEHGHWWVTITPTGATFSVVDAEGGDSVNGFGFELVVSEEEQSG